MPIASGADPTPTMGLPTHFNGDGVLAQDEMDDVFACCRRREARYRPVDFAFP